MQKLPDALAPFGAYRQFIAYTLVPRNDGTGKVDKFPVDCRTGKVASAHDPAIWTDAQTALATVNAWGAPYGVGFVFTENDPFFFLDIDGCLLPDGSGWTPNALALLKWFPGAAVEVSQSGRGLHIFGAGVCPAHGCKNAALGLEFYTSGRFVALTGTNAVGSAALDFSAVLPSFVAQLFPPTADADLVDWTEGPVEGWAGPTDDEQLINVALRSSSAASAFGNRASFRDLWERNEDVLARVYPEAGGKSRPYDESTADAALAQHLAFWTGNDCERIRRLMQRSALVRDKWERADYLPRTILRACSLQKTWATGWTQSTTVPAATPAAGATPDAEPVLVAGAQFMPVDMQREYFRGCVYVCEDHRILVPGGRLLKPEQFRVMFGGYTFPMDTANEKVTRNAWEVFSESQAVRFPKADGACFRPDLEPGAIVENDGVSRVNIYWPVEVRREAGDVGPFLRHLAKVIPNERDQAILLAYMAACVQYKGVKFQWAPFLQGAEGNGKTLFTRCVAYAVGDRYSHFPKAQEIASKFNDWMFGTIFIGVEDIYVPDSKADVWEALKPMITSDRLEIEGKGGKKVTLGVCCNFLINSNHKDGLRKTRNDRRIAPFFTAQQTDADLARDGMTGTYFVDLYDWLKGTGRFAGAAPGYAHVAEFLQTYAIPDELNPAKDCHRAPVTSSTEAAIAAGLGSIEQEIIEAIEQGVPGFANGWVSSIALDRLLEKLNRSRAVPPNKRRDLLVSLGYDWHPGLVQGRVNNIIAPDNGKPRLFIRQGHIAAQLVGPANIARAYTEAQGGSVASVKAAQVFAAPPPPPSN